MNKFTIIVAAAALATLAGCSTKEETQREPEPELGVEEGVFDPMVDSIERARQLEAEVENRVNELNRQLEEIEGNEQP